MTAKSQTVTAEPAQQEAPFICLVALDDGSGNIACSFYDKGNTLWESYQPSLVEAGAAAGLGTNNMSDHIWITEEGETFTVRQNATKPITTLDPAYQLSQANRVLAIDTMAKAGLGGTPCVVGLTLPVEQFYRRGDAQQPINLERIAAKKANITKGVTNKYAAYEVPNILSVVVYPEAYPAYFYCANQPGANYPEEHKTLVVDLGEFTADLAVITSGNEFGDFSTHEHGVHLMVAHFRTLLARIIDDAYSMPDADVKKVISRGYVGSPSDSPAAVAARIDVTPLIKEAADHLNHLLMADIRELTRGQLLDRIVFVGGGANWLREQAQQWHHTVDIPSEPHLAIMRGVQLLLQSASANLLTQAAAILNQPTKEPA